MFAVARFLGQWRLTAVVESSDDAIISKTLDGTVTGWNAGAEILARLRKGQGVTHFETMRRRKDGALVPISITVSPIRDAAGQVTGGAVVARDVSAERRALEVQQRSAISFRGSLQCPLR